MFPGKAKISCRLDRNIQDANWKRTLSTAANSLNWQMSPADSEDTLEVLQTKMPYNNQTKFQLQEVVGAPSINYA